MMMSVCTENVRWWFAEEFGERQTDRQTVTFTWCSIAMNHSSLRVAVKFFIRTFFKWFD